jgi:hypothetical protein
MMIRRAFLATSALLFSRRLAFAQQRPSGSENVRQVLDVQGLVTKALQVAAVVEKEAELRLRSAVDRAFSIVEVPSVPLNALPPSRVPDLFVAQGNLPILLFALLKAAKTADGRIVVTQAAVEQSLREFCPLYPFC